jgi:hypothetical protein
LFDAGGLRVDQRKEGQAMWVQKRFSHWGQRGLLERVPVELERKASDVTYRRTIPHADSRDGSVRPPDQLVFVGSPRY